MATAFLGGGVDRAASIRTDAAKVEGALAQGRVLALWRGKVLLHNDQSGAPQLGWLAQDHPVFASVTDTVFLGLADGKACFARDLSGSFAPDAPVAGTFLDNDLMRHPALPDAYAFADLRAVMLDLSASEAELAATAKAVLHWHDSHRFCARCGAVSAMVEGGWRRHCGACGADHFPRTDPVVIMLVTHGNRALLGRNAAWPEGMYSCLAGFVEPGETVENAVRREVAEEAGIRIGTVRYAACQPWPFPASLMIGCLAEAETDQITIDTAELQDALWISREDMLAVMAQTHPTIKPARKGAIAHSLIQNWLADLRG